MDFSTAYSGLLVYVEWMYSVVCEYVDLVYGSYLAWLLYPLILTLILPAIILLLVYASSLFLHLYRLRHQLQGPLQDALHKRQVFAGGRHILAALWDAHGYIWHGYEVIGLEKIPDTGPALLIYYHGTIPIDLYYLMAKVILHKQRLIWSIGDRFLFKIPGWGLLLEVLRVVPGTVTKGVEIMRGNNLLSIAPGGVREAYFSDEYYPILWGKRVGFAKIAIESEVPIIPIFTQNCREAFRTPGLIKSCLRNIYERTRLPIVPIYGGFPVKLRTFIGDPIYCNSSMNPEQLAKQVRDSVQDLIDRHQQIPGTILNGILERFYTPEHVKDS